jgi:hypothetical protein
MNLGIKNSKLMTAYFAMIVVRDMKKFFIIKNLFQKDSADFGIRKMNLGIKNSKLMTAYFAMIVVRDMKKLFGLWSYILKPTTSSLCTYILLGAK